MKSQVGDEGIYYYTFMCTSKKSQEEVRVPPALFFSIDRCDGHLWQKEDFYNLDLIRLITDQD